MNKKLLTTLLLTITTLSAVAERLQFKCYTGGMFYHSGHIKSNPFEITNKQGEISIHQVKGLTFGLGGKLSFQFGNHLRVGIEGYGSSVTYGPHKSTYSVGWGGGLTEFFYETTKVAYFLGATMGGGSVENLVVTERQTLGFKTSEILRRQYSTIIIAPYYGAEIKLTRRIRFVYKADYLLPVTNKQPDWGRGFRWYVGINFRPQTI